MSALPPKADMCGATRMSTKGQKRTCARQRLQITTAVTYIPAAFLRLSHSLQ